MNKSIESMEYISEKSDQFGRRSIETNGEKIREIGHENCGFIEGL